MKPFIFLYQFDDFLGTFQRRQSFFPCYLGFSFLTNNSSYAIDVTISATDMTGGITWTLSDTATPGADTYGLRAGLEGGSYNVVVRKNGPYNTLVSSLAGSGGTQNWGLQLLVPTSFSDGAVKSGTITLTAVQS